MNIKIIEKVNSKVKELKKLDKRIVYLEKFAHSIAISEKPSELELELSYAQENKKKEKTIVYEGNSLNFVLSPIYFSNPTIDDDKKKNFNIKILDTDALEVLGLLIYKLNKKRELLIKELNNIGVEL